MCSSLLNTAYSVLILIALGLSITSLVTPNWSNISISASLKEARNGNYTQIVKGLLFGCDYVTLDTFDGWKACFEDQRHTTPEKVSIGFFFLGIAFAFAGFIWSLVACCACCCRSCLSPPLPAFSGLSCACIVIAVGVFGFYNEPEIGAMPTTSDGLMAKFDRSNTVGYSFWIGCVAAVTLFVNTIVGVLLVKSSKN